MKSKEFTKELFESLYAEHGSVKAVAAAIGRSPDTASSWMHRFGIKPRIGPVRKFDPDPIVLNKQYQDMPMSKIAEHYGVGETTVWLAIKRLGIKFEGNEENDGSKRKRAPFTEEHRRKMSLARQGKYRGENSPTWKGGIAQEHIRLRQSRAYRVWQQEAKNLRGNACQECGAVDGSVCDCCGTRVKLHVHHVKSFAKFPETRFDPTNSEVLCPKCHHSRHRCKSGELLETP